MEIFTIVMYIINVVSLILLAIGWFKENYTIVDLETWNKIATFYNKYAGENGEVSLPELEGGTGFFREYIEEVYDDDEEEEEE